MINEDKIKQLGQITKYSTFGKKIFELVSHPEVKNILEIGTTWGVGSTLCILEGIMGKKDFKVISLECRKERVDQAIKNLLVIPLNNFDIVYGTITTYEELNELVKEFPESPLREWIKEDLVYLKNAPYVFDKLPDKLDFVLIDGGEFSGWIEFNKLWERSRFIALDDTESYKHSRSKQFILDNPDKFKILYEDIIERTNGALICENLT